MSSGAMMLHCHPIYECPGPDQHSVQSPSSRLQACSAVALVLQVNTTDASSNSFTNKGQQGAVAKTNQSQDAFQQAPLCLLIMTEVDTQLSLIADNRM